MAFEIVDGRTGNPHISSEDLACFNEAIIGESNCVFEWGNEFACTMSDANTATVASGAGMVGGKRFWNQASTNVTIQSGTQGQNRNDLIVARYDITDDGIESITPKVIKGTATTGTATDPSVTDDDLPLYRIPLSGISVGQPVKLFEPIQSITSFRDSISREEYGIATSSSVAARGSTATEITFDTPFSEPPCVFVQDRSGGGNVSDMINNKTIVSGVTLGGFTARSFNNTSTTFPDGMTFYWRAVGK